MSLIQILPYPPNPPQPLRTSSLHGSALCPLGVVVRFPSLLMSRVSVAGAPPAASTFGGAEYRKKAGSSPSNGVATTSPWRVLSAEARWNRQSALQPLCQTWSSTLRCRSCPNWSRATLREFSSVRPAGLGLGLGGTMLESIRVTGECKHGWPRWRGCSGWRPLGFGLEQSRSPSPAEGRGNAVQSRECRVQPIPEHFRCYIL